MLHDDNLTFDLIEVTSGAFRMAAFFAIAGFLAARSLSYRPADTWFLARSLKIGLPAAFGVLVISPAIWTMMKLSLPTGKTANVLVFEWHHFWFLFALLLYQAFAHTLAVRLAPRSIASGLVSLRRLGQAKVLLGLTLLSLVLTLLTLKAVLLLAPAALQPMLLQVRLIAAYAPLYLFGMALGASTSLRKSMLRDARVPASIVAVIGCAYLAWHLGIGPTLPSNAAAGWEVAIRVSIGALCPPAAVLLVMRSALAIRFTNRWIDRLCAASFTIYLIHYPLVMGMNIAASHFDAPPLLEYAIAILLVGGLSYAFHVLVVDRSATLTLLLNGRLARNTTSRAADARHESISTSPYAPPA